MDMFSNFNSLYDCTVQSHPCFVVNSAASKLMQDYEKAYVSVCLCEKYIKDMQGQDESEHVPGSFFASMYELKDAYESDLAQAEERLVSQVSTEALDIWDRKVYTRLNADVREALQEVLDDDVIKRVMEMQTESLREMADTVTEEPKESDKEDESDDDFDFEDTEENVTESKPKEDDYGLDVSSTEG